MKIADTLLYKEYLAQKEEVMKHKWYESEKAGHDIGFVQAIIDLTIKHKTEWLNRRKNNS